jgi:hypothetical protein
MEPGWKWKHETVGTANKRFRYRWSRRGGARNQRNSEQKQGDTDGRSSSFGNGKKQWSLLHNADLMLHSTGAGVKQRWKRQVTRNNTPDAGKECRKRREPG